MIKKQVLLIEDDPFLIDIYTTKLKEAGFEVGVAEDGERALEKIKERTPDLVILDIVLPNIDGWGILKEIRKDEKFKNLKVMILSNLGQRKEVEKGIKLGATQYLIKAHHTPSQVMEKIRQILNIT